MSWGEGKGRANQSRVIRPERRYWYWGCCWSHSLRLISLGPQWCRSTRVPRQGTQMELATDKRQSLETLFMLVIHPPSQIHIWYPRWLWRWTNIHSYTSIVSENPRFLIDRSLHIVGWGLSTFVLEMLIYLSSLQKNLNLTFVQFLPHQMLPLVCCFLIALRNSKRPLL